MSGRNSSRVTCPSVACSILMAVSGAMLPFPVRSQKTPACVRPAFRASAACDPPQILTALLMCLTWSISNLIGHLIANVNKLSHGAALIGKC